MAGLVPAIHVSDMARVQGVDARDKRGHDGLMRTFVIASEAKQSSSFFVALDCFVASLLAMTSSVRLPHPHICARRRSSMKMTASVAPMTRSEKTVVTVPRA